MSAEDWRRVRELFEAALEREPPSVPAWLEQQAPGDERIRREVLSLLSHHQAAGSFLSDPLAVRAPGLLEDADPLTPGERLGPYSIVREVGRGGMGRVYLAVDARLGRQVVLKALPFRLSESPVGRERLRKEAQAAAQLTHPGICTVYALEEIDGALFIAAEYIEGRTLREEIAGGVRPSRTEILTMIRELAAALASAHAKSIVHGDLKPENIMRAADGRWKILDFGLARVDTLRESADEGASGAQSASGLLIGTPAYMAPEQLNGHPGDARSDVFAFGVVAYEYAAGVHPFDAATPLSMAARVLEDTARPLEDVRPDVPAEIVAPLERCLRKTPADRWPNAIDMAMAFARGDAVPPRPIGGTAWWQVHQATLMLLYIVACVVAWEIKEMVHGFTTATFISAGVGSALSGTLRGHVLFTNRMNPGGLLAERRKVDRLTLGGDLLVAGSLAGAGALVAATRPLDAMLTLAFAIGLVVARLVLEPATTAAVFPDR